MTKGILRKKKEIKKPSKSAIKYQFRSLYTLLKREKFRAKRSLYTEKSFCYTNKVIC